CFKYVLHDVCLTTVPGDIRRSARAYSVYIVFPGGAKNAISLLMDSPPAEIPGENQQMKQVKECNIFNL
ncbi:hypothetical protein KKD52_04435, partial [Myxococcota bacterium]|nr:hypothetical protein [Myxococcota bacterium]